MTAALQEAVVYPIFFFEFEFSNGTLRLWNGGFGDFVWDSKTWSGVGWLLGMSEVEETTETKSTSLTVGLPANAELISIALQNVRRNQPLTIWMGLRGVTGEVVIGDPDDDTALGDPDSGLVFGEETGGLLDTPLVWFSGLCDVSLITVDPLNPSVQIRYKSRIADLERARVRRQTPEDQAIDFPNDKFYDFVGPLTDARFNWGNNG